MPVRALTDSLFPPLFFLSSEQKKYYINIDFISSLFVFMVNLLQAIENYMLYLEKENCTGSNFTGSICIKILCLCLLFFLSLYPSKAKIPFLLSVGMDRRISLLSSLFLLFPKVILGLILENPRGQLLPFLATKLAIETCRFYLSAIITFVYAFLLRLIARKLMGSFYA